MLVFTFLFVVACLLLKIPGVQESMFFVFDQIENAIIWLLPENLGR